MASPDESIGAFVMHIFSKHRRTLRKSARENYALSGRGSLFLSVSLDEFHNNVFGALTYETALIGSNERGEAVDVLRTLHADLDTFDPLAQFLLVVVVRDEDGETRQYPMTAKL